MKLLKKTEKKFVKIYSLENILFKTIINEKTKINTI